MRQKHVYRDATEVAHVWATKPDRDIRSANCYTEGDTIYSYGRHFPMARHLPDGSVAITTRRYSPTTSGHVWAVRSAVSHLKTINVPDVVSSPSWCREATVKEIDKSLQEAAGSRMKVTKAKHQAAAVYAAEQFNLYSKACGSRLKIDAKKIEGVDLGKIKDFVAARAKREAAAVVKREKARMQEQAEKREAWRLGVSRNYFSGPVMLRLSDLNVFEEARIVETSAGASIPVDAALRLWPVILRCREGAKEYEVGMELGDYRLTKIRSDGSIVVGCHDIAFSEIEGIAGKLGLLKEALAA